MLQRMLDETKENCLDAALTFAQQYFFLGSGRSVMEDAKNFIDLKA